MRILIAPDKFAGTLTAVEAADAIATGWRRRAPHDETVLVPMADGGPGFVDVLHAALGGEVHVVTVRGPLGEPVPAAFLRVDDTAYVESAQACGVHLTRGADGERATTYGVGELVAAAVDSGATRVLVGLGGSGTNDAGAGFLAALGATGDVDLASGALTLGGLTRCDLGAVRERLAGTQVVAATDVDNPLAGLFGATRSFGAQKGIAEDRQPAVDALLEHLGSVVDRRTALLPGAGAAGGLGFALLALGATRRPGFDVVAEAVGLDAQIRDCDLVVTGEGAFDFSSRSGKVPYGVAQRAAAGIRPCIALAGRVQVSSREMRALGIESAYSVVDLVGEERALAEPAVALADLAQRVARTWSR